MVIVSEHVGDVLRLTMCRPSARNALNSELVDRLAAELRSAERDDAVGAIVLDGAPPGFCAGSDVRELGQLDAYQIADHEARTAAVARGIAALSTPVIAVVEGFAIGGGLVLAASCDLVVSGAGARWHLPEVSIGWVPPWGFHALLSRMSPVAARRLVWGMAPFLGEEAHACGLVDYVVDDGEALDRAMALGVALSRLPRTAVRSTKRALESFVVGGAEVLDGEANRLFLDDIEQPVGQQTLTRFLEKK